MLSYKSDFPNQVHQLNISLSQHYHRLANDSIKWESKKFNVNWSNFRNTEKEHLVTFIIRDHFSNCFYAEFHSVDKMSSVQEFLFNAWTKKEQYPFYGMPDCLIVPKVTRTQFPAIGKFISKFNGLNIQTPTSGFTTAVVSIRQWERLVKGFSSFFSDCDTLSKFQKNIQLKLFRLFMMRRKY